MKGNRNIIISGASGFLGHFLVKGMEHSDHNILKLGRGKENDLVYDLSQDSFPPEFPSEIDIVIHAAGKAHMVPKTEKEVNEFYKVNFEGTKNLCASFINAKTRVKSFIFISSVAVYGRDEGKLINEEFPLDAKTPYGKSKLLAEEWLRKWAKLNDIKLGILRLPLVVGPNPPGNLGAMINGIRNGRYLSIGPADAQKSVVWAEDIPTVINNCSEIGGVFNLTDDFHPSFQQLERTISESIGKKLPKKITLSSAKLIARIGDVLGDRFPINSVKLKKITSTLTFDDSKARKLLHWQPSNVLQKVASMLSSRQ